MLLVLANGAMGQTPDDLLKMAKIERMLDDGRGEEAFRTAKSWTEAQFQSLPVADAAVGNLQRWLGALYLRAGRFQEAQLWTQRSLDHRLQHLKKGDLQVGDAHLQMAKVHLEAGEVEPAEEQLAMADARYKAAGEAGRAQHVIVLEQRAGLCLMQGRLSEAERRYDTILRFQATMLGDQHPNLAQTLNNLGGTYLAQGNASKAQGAYAQALQLQTAALGPDAPAIATTATNLGVMYDQNADYDLAERYLLQAYAIRCKALQLQDPLVLVSLDNLVSFYLKREAYPKAEAILDMARQQREQRLGTDQPAVAEIIDRFATLSMARNQAALAEQYWLKALQIRENSLGPQNEAVAATLYNLGKLENILGKHDQARIHLNWASDIYEYQTIGNEAQVTAILSELFMCDFMQGKLDAAEENLSLMYTIKTEVYGPRHPETLAVMEELLKFYKNVGWDSKAEATEAKMLQAKTGK
jgi:Flp pilus assembly protein TadD